jgi:hypothetical protein
MPGVKIHLRLHHPGQAKGKD